MLKKFVFLFLLLMVLTPVSVSIAQPSGLPVDVPREDLFVVDQILRWSKPGNDNFWVTGADNPATRHALSFDTLWLRDQESGERLMDVAISQPMYNADYTEMSVDLRDNIFWTDGVQFTADDLVYTVETIKANSDLNASGWSSSLNQFMDSVEKTGDFSVTFHLTEPNPRFHTLFEARWNGVYMMPKHYFENIDDLATFTNWGEDVPILGAYKSVDFDPNGFWELFQRRDDWERSPAGIETGNPGPPYVLTIFYGDSTRKTIAMSRGELDVLFDLDFEAFESLLDTTPTARSWYTDFPWAYPNEVSTRSLTFNYETYPEFQDKDVRWALALALDIVDLQTTYIGGVAKVTPFPVPATPALARIYLDPMEEWLQNLQIELSDGTMYNPYDPSVPDRIAEWAQGQGYALTGTPREVFGSGWWKHDTDAAASLLEKAGFSRDDGGNWLKPDGTPWTIEIQAAPDEPDAFRIANAAADMWSDFGIDVKLQGLERAVWESNLYTGQFQMNVPWFAFAQVSGDAWPDSRNIDPATTYVPVGEDTRTVGGNYMAASRLQDPKISEFIDSMIPINPDDPASVELATDFYKYWTENMFAITTISFKKFITWDERYWTGFPTFEAPNYQPLYWFEGGKYGIQSLMPSGS
ncbi:MAG: ABC transporter substrate-binding protein [Anaerolineae bacterium]|nr:ABC transporter substrate-binding protein [Anaerolineae bacterium]